MLNERALTEAAKALNRHKPLSWKVAARACVLVYLAALPEPPLDEWLKEKHAEAICELGQARSNQPEYIRWNARVAAFDEVLEALAEHRKGSGDRG